MTVPSRFLIVLSIVALLIGAGVLIITAVLVRGVTEIDMCSLAHIHGPSSEPDSQQRQPYEDLYRSTELIMRQRNHLAVWFGYSLGVSALLLAWWIDRERLWRRIGG